MRFVALDTETSGLLDDPDARVVEVAAAVFDAELPDAGPLATYTSLVRPDVLTAAGCDVVRRISHLDPDVIRAAPLPEVVLAELAVFLGGLPVRSYNWEFDGPMIARSFGPAGLVLPLPWPVLPVAEPASWRRSPGCIMEAFALRYRPYTTTHEDGRPRFVRLARAARLLGIAPEGDLHRALADAVLAGRIAVSLDRGAVGLDVAVDPFEVEREVRVLPDVPELEVDVEARPVTDIGEIEV